MPKITLFGGGNAQRAYGIPVALSKYWFASATGAYQYALVTSDGSTYFVANGASPYIILVDKSGNLLWKKQFSAAYFSAVNGAVIDSNDDLYIVGQNVSGSFGNNGRIAKISKSGSLLWDKRSTIAPFSSIAVSPSAVYVGTLGSVGIPASILSFSFSGTLNWQQQYDNISASAQLSYYSGTLYSAYDQVVATFDTSGNVLSSYSLAGTPANFYSMFKAQVNPYNGSLWATAENLTSSVTKLGILKISGSSISFQTLISSATSIQNIGTPISFDSSNVYIMGASGGNIIILNYTNSNSLVWQRALSNPAVSVEAGIDIQPSEGMLVAPGYIGRLPLDGSKTGSYTVGATSVVYSNPSLGFSSTSISLNSITVNTTTYSSSIYSNEMTLVTPSVFNYTKLNI